jgi:hypothetical protein
MRTGQFKWRQLGVDNEPLKKKDVENSGNQYATGVA